MIDVPIMQQPLHCNTYMGNLPVSCDVQVGYVMYPMDSGVVEQLDGAVHYTIEQLNWMMEEFSKTVKNCVERGMSCLLSYLFE